MPDCFSMVSITYLLVPIFNDRPYTWEQTISRDPTTTMSSKPSSAALTSQPRSDSITTSSHNTSDSVELGIMTNRTTLNSVNLSFLGGCLCSAIYPSNFIACSYRTDVAKFFEPSVRCIADSVLKMAANTHQPIKVRSPQSDMSLGTPHIVQHVVLVGGFSASDWLVTKVSQVLSPKGLNVVHPENYV
jgi:hypothetical protein